MTKETKNSTIKLENVYFERINTPAFQSLLHKSPFESPRPRYWLGKIIDKITRESKYYFDAKRDLIDKFSKKHTEDGEEKDKKGEVTKEWKKGDAMARPDGSAIFEDTGAFVGALRELQEMEIDLKEPRIDVDEAPDVPLEEMMLLIPLLVKDIKFREEKKGK